MIAHSRRDRKPVSSPNPAAASDALLFAVCLAQFMVILDVAVVNVALPAMHRNLHFSTTGLQWVVNSYTLTFAGFLLLGGRAADLLGRRRVFLAGTALFALASLLSALADSRGLLLGARALQGFGGAILSPATLAIITSALPEGPERARGIAAWGAVGGLGASSGALLGGILTQTLGWPAIFAINLPLGALVLLGGLRVIPADGPRRIGHFDSTGAVLVTGALGRAHVRDRALGRARMGQQRGRDADRSPARACWSAFLLWESALRPVAAGAALDLPHRAPADREPGGGADVCGTVLDVLLRHALPAGRAR